MTAPTLGLCVIVKNEASRIAELLAHAQPHCERMIVIDTGSADDTVALAKSCGADVSSFAWVDDFSVARNVSIERCDTDWILVLDADERLMPEDWAAVRQAMITANGGDCFYLRQINYVSQKNVVGFQENVLNVAEYAAYQGFVESWLARLFKNESRFRFGGTVHEHLLDNGKLADGRRLPVAIHHTGQTLPADDMLRKRKLYQRLGEKKASQKPSFKSFHELGVASLEIGRAAEAQVWFEKARELKSDDTTNLIALASVLQIRKKFDDAERVLKTVLKIDEKNRQVRLALGGCLRAAGRFDDAISFLREQIRSFPDDALARRWLCEAYREARAADPSRRAVISACYIVKNEQDCLLQSLQSLAGLADEIIVADTGSDDTTMEIAKSAGAKVFSIAWQDDFAKARNESLKRATGEWILVLDADEVFPHQDRDKILEIAQCANLELVSLVQTTFSDRATIVGWRANDLPDGEAQGHVGYLKSPLVRFFRNTPDIAFHGAVHEHAKHVRAETPILASALRIFHYGKLRPAERMRQKYDLYRRIGEKKLKTMPSDAQAHFELAVQLWELGLNRPEAEALFRSAIEILPKQSEFRLAYASFLMESGRSADACEQFAGAIAAQPDNPEPYVYAASLLTDLGSLDTALQFLNHARSCGGDRLVALHLNEATIFAKLGWHDKAAQALVRAEAINPKFAPIWLNRALFAKARGDWGDAEKSARYAVELAPHDLAGWQILGEILFAAGRCDDAFEIFTKAYEMAPQNLAVLWQTLLSSYATNRGEITACLERKLVEMGSDDQQARKRCVELAAIYRSRNDHKALMRISELQMSLWRKLTDEVVAPTMERSL